MMKTAGFRSVLLFVLSALTLPGLAGGAELGDILRSAVYPGIGQLGTGTTLGTVKGLSFMVVETALLSLTVAEASKTNAFARETKYQEVKYQLATTYEDRVQEYSAWEDAAGKSDDAKLLAMAFGGVAAAVWIINVVDVIVFPSSKNTAYKESGLLQNARLAVSPSGIKCTVEF